MLVWLTDWRFDSYGDAVDQPSRRARGEVAQLMSVRCRQIQTAEGIVPAPGEARLQPVRDTSGSWMRGAGQVTGESDGDGCLYG
ncbi:hypothetical protein QCD70_07010 [Agreia sp. PsM10]|uniref:hypothetical protein n=1 Tax=Agreia sp. PsM10 TaxID=3030533 RepID=UPI00263BCC1A|nr:hypothetical protein [Agreia sp. PsM10]MDN4639987.1 hypothetical protein [Agreia sp. PsM10]